MLFNVRLPLSRKLSEIFAGDTMAVVAVPGTILGVFSPHSAVTVHYHIAGQLGLEPRTITLTGCRATVALLTKQEGECLPMFLSLQGPVRGTVIIIPFLPPRKNDGYPQPCEVLHKVIHRVIHIVVSGDCKLWIT